MFLSVILAIITYVPNTQTQSQGDQSQCKPTDKQIPENCLVERAPASTDLPLELSVMDVQRLAQMEHWRDICISVVEKGCRRQRCSNYTGKIRNKIGFPLLQELAEECSQPMEEVVPTYVVPVSPSHQTEKAGWKPTLSPVLDSDFKSTKFGDVISVPKFLSSTPSPDILNLGPEYSVTLLKHSKLPLSPTCSNGDVQTAVAQSMMSSTLSSDTMDLGPAYSVILLKDSRLPLSPACSNAYLWTSMAQSIISSASSPDNLNLGSAFSVSLLEDSRLPLSPTCPNSYVQTTVAKSIMEPTAMKMSSFDLRPEPVPVNHDPSQSCQNRVLRPEFVTNSPPILNLGSNYSAPHDSDITLPRDYSDLILRPETVVPFSTRVPLGRSSIRLVADPTISMSPSCTDPELSVDFLASSLAQPSPSIDLTTFEPTPDIKVDSRIQAIRATLAKQVKICKESKARVSKAAKALRNAWKHDSKYRRWIQVRKQAAKIQQITGDKVEELRREEEKIRADIERMKSTS